MSKWREILLVRGKVMHKAGGLEKLKVWRKPRVAVGESEEAIPLWIRPRARLPVARTTTKEEDEHESATIQSGVTLSLGHRTSKRLLDGVEQVEVLWFLLEC